MKVLVTGGSGFIGSAVCLHLVNDLGIQVVNLDKLTYAANPRSLASLDGDSRYAFESADICDAQAVDAILARHRPEAIMHLAAESHVDRSIDGPQAFIETNLVGTFTLLNGAYRYWLSLEGTAREHFRFHHISTDEVYGSLGPAGLFEEDTPYAPNSPYSASKAGSDHLVRAWQHTYGLPTLLTNCSNNYGPRQFPEKLIPLTIINGLEGKPLPVYGNGLNVRDWLHVEDHARALALVLLQGKVGRKYNVGGECEKTNLEVVHAICAILDELVPNAAGPHQRLISFVTDRPGHDARYAIDTARITTELGWRPRETFESGLAQTVRWYLANRDWWGCIRSGTYRGERLGLCK